MKRLVSLVLLLALAAMPAMASTFIKMNQKDLVRDSAAVIQGEVVQVNSFWEPTGTIIVTEALVKVEDVVFGNAPSVAVVRTAGGEVDGFYIEAHGFPVFKAGERVLLYLEPERDGYSRVTGYRQGQYQIVRDKAGVEYAVPTYEDAAGLVGADGRPAPVEKTIRLDVLKETIRGEARRAGRILAN
ncbi:MAG TPA: hypothetical protein VE685_11765 [Thermoanaerobaculia bacterium]|nr:hypothetical protein [Thermoanaerobaculia bacterium]